MPETSLPAAPEKTAPVLHGGALGRLAMPLFLFATSLVGLLMLSWTFILPHFTRFSINGQLLGATSLAAYGQQLKKEVHVLETQRDDLVLPGHGDTYENLREQRAARPRPDAIRSAILSVAADVTALTNISLLSVTYDFAHATVHIEGDIHGVGPSSMTVLAQFVDALSQASFVASLTPPSYVREEGTKGAFHSPFTLDFTLKPLGLSASAHE